MTVRPEVISTDYQAVLTDLITNFEAMTGRTLQPAQVDRILIDLMAYEGTNQRIAMKDAALQAFPQFARDYMLDLHAEAAGLKRLEAQPARTIIEFTLSSAKADDTIIGSGQLIASKDNVFVFRTTENVTILAGQTKGQSKAVCETATENANGYLAGEVLNITVPIPHVETALNVSVTSGGSEKEPDVTLLERILLAPFSYSVAGSKGTYKSLARSAHSSIVDVEVLGKEDHGQAGIVRIYPLTKDGPASAEVQQLVLDAVSDEKPRPITDSIEIIAPVSRSYNVTADVIIEASAVAEEVQEKVEEALRAVVAKWALNLGADILPSRLIAAAEGVQGVHHVSLAAPAYTELANNEWPALGTLTVNITGVSNG